MSTFKFQPKWKEELVVTGPGGSFGLEFPMGGLSVYAPSALLPPESAWRLKVPDWAKDLWPVIREELETWCMENNVRFVIDETAMVFKQT